MNIDRYIRFARKVWSVGLKRTLRSVQYRLRSRLPDERRAGSTWFEFQKSFDVSYTPHQWMSVHQQRSLSYVADLYAEVPREQILLKAREILERRFDVLGSGSFTYQTMPWHTDIRLLHGDGGVSKGQDASFNVATWHDDIKLEIGGDQRLVRDVKVPWELSRCQHLVVLGAAYRLTNDESYVRCFVDQMNDWIEKNPYGYGVNWMCPMEVALRTINWIYAYELMKKTSHCSSEFVERMTCSLFDHMRHLEKNWEWYDGRTSNHYLSDLVGYAALCWFFDGCAGSADKRAWVFEELQREIAWQIFSEGTSYEGSTAYHRLVTELLVHALLLAHESKVVISESVVERVQRMISFVKVCMIDNDPYRMITIGDNDSGRVTFVGLTQSMMRDVERGCIKKIDALDGCAKSKKREVAIVDVVAGDASCLWKTYQSFGLSVLKTDVFHMSVRHHAYEARQPSGHFHNDGGSITVAVRGLEFIVDPGSYVYTPSVYWRNHFRSVSQHNTFFIASFEPVPLDNRLFALDMMVSSEPAVANHGNGVISRCAGYTQYGLVSQRGVSVDGQTNTISFVDRWKMVDEYRMQAAGFDEGIPTIWGFTLDPRVEVVMNDGRLMLIRDTIRLHVCSEQLIFSCEPALVSYDYGTKVQTIQIRACKKIHLEESVRFELRVH